MTNLKAEMSTPQTINLIPIPIFYQLFLVIGYHILLEGLKMGREVLDPLGLGVIIIGNGSDGDLILYESHEL